MNECDIFMGALEFDAPEERSAFLDESCRGDEQLRSRVERLLECHSESGSLLEHPAADLAATHVCAETDAAAKSAGDPTLLDLSHVPLDFLQPAAQDGSLGRLGQYEILEPVGCGGMGIVLKAQDTKLHRVVAVKVLSPELASNATARKRFLREAQAAAAISHDHVVTIYAVEENEREGQKGLPYLVMEFIDGQSLQEKLNHEGPLELREILRIGRQMASGLAAAHEQGLIHRDVKPTNILLQNGVERVQITDFGLARAVDDEGMTKPGEVTGTPQYMSPEQAQGHPVDVRSDLFSLGSVLYAMCTGRSPFRADTSVAALRRVCDDTPRPIREINPDVPEWLVAIIDRLLEKDREDRFQSAAEVAELLGKHLAHLQDPGSTPFPGTVEPAKRRASRAASAAGSHRWLVAGLLLIALATALGVTEATGVTKLASTVIRLATGEGTLVIEIDDPSVEVSLDGEELTITGAGIKELKLRPGQYQFQATKDGKAVKQELVTITRGDRQIVRVIMDAPPRAVAIPHEQRAEVSVVTQSRVLAKHDDSVLAVAFSPDGQLAATGGGELIPKFVPGKDFDIRLWNVESGEEVNRLKGHSSSVLCLMFSPDGKYLLSGSRDTSLYLWEVASGREIRRFKGHSRNVWCAAFSPDGRYILSGGDDRRLFKWSVASGRPVWSRPVDMGAIWCVAFSPDGKFGLSGDGGDASRGGGVLRLWNMETGEQIRQMKGHATAPRGVTFTPDGQRAFSVARDKSIRTWDVASGREINRINHDKEFPCLALSPNGRHLLTPEFYSARFDPHSLMLWDLEEDRPTHQFNGHTAPINGVAISPDGRFALSGGYDGTARLWKLPESVWANASATIEGGAFAVLGGDGAEIAKFDTLADAVNGSTPGDTIEIRGNGPFVTEPIEIRHALRIRAGEGFRPAIVDDGTTKLSWSRPLINVQAPLVLEGLEIQCTMPGEGGYRKEHPHLLTAMSPLRLANCRLITAPWSRGIWSSSSGVMRNCETLVSNNIEAILLSWDSEEEFHLENSISSGQINVFPSRGAHGTLQLTGNTLIKPEGHILFVSLSETPQIAERQTQRISILSTGNVFDAARSVLCLCQSMNAKELLPFDRVEALLPKLVAWQEQRNLYGTIRRFLALGVHGKGDLPTTRGHNLSDWQDYWGLSDTDSLQDVIRYQGGDLHAKAWPISERLLPNDFRLREDSAGYKAGPDGKDLGANIDLVGPGEAYERWKKTREYQKWLNESAKLMQTGHNEQAVRAIEPAVAE